MVGDADDLVHVIFELDVEDGWPPVSAERMWARDLGNDRYRLDNVPWFVRGIAEGDVVRALPEAGEGWPVFVERLEWSGNLTIRVIPFRNGPLGGDLQAVLDAFIPLGATGEGAGTYPIVALTVPADADQPAIKALLRAGTADGRWEFEEGCVDDAWIGS